MSAAIIVGLLVFAGVYLALQRELVRAVLGFILLGHAANVVLLSAGGLHLRQLPLVGDGVPPESADPLPQAFALTAIVITFGITIYLLVLSLRTPEDGDEPENDPAATPESGTPAAATSPEAPEETPATAREDLSGRSGPERGAP
ncbi:hypothetical protein GCM10009696_00320 [Kocuria himachalensis]